ncbi:magnesium transporter [Candidatus Bathyarchaeota archaeon]|nr:magnesium transporter [Candidatus Bathyarchaeota archaeon]MBS7617169.1 magnesium transporter [Candidatus Bathyarchaeota archaeon]
MLYPIMMTLRGNIGGIFSARLSTSLNLGTIRPSFRRNTPLFMILVSAVNSVSFLLSFLSGLIVFSAQIIIVGFKPWLLGVILLTALGVQTISMSIAIPITCILGFVSFKHNIDPDIIIYPIMSTVTDIIESFTYIVAIIMVKSLIGLITLLFICILCLLVVLFFVKNYGKEEFIESIKQALASLILSLFIGWLSGLALSSVRSKLEMYPSIMIIYPAIIDTLGDFGASIGSILTTRLSEGSISPKLSLNLLELYEAIQMWLSALMYFIVYACIAFVNGFQGIHAIMLCFILSSPIILFVCKLSAIGIFKRNLDPDNFVIPFETTLSDFLGTILLSFFLGVI